MKSLAQSLDRYGALVEQIVLKSRELGISCVLKHGVSTAIEKLRAIRKYALSENDAFDLKYGTDTGNTVGVWALGIPRAMLGHAHRYETLSAELLIASLRVAKIKCERFVFIDLGSGKGRALLVASLFPFKRIIGVEISVALNKITRKNIALFKDGCQKCTEIEALCLNVCDYELPQEDLILYMYNPFDEHVMGVVVAKVEMLVRQHGKRVYVIYHNPAYRDLWDQARFMQPVSLDARCTIYVSKEQRA
jgi:predicted RNA methylase